MGCIIKELNGLWNFTTDPEKIGEQNEWYINGLKVSPLRSPGPGKLTIKRWLLIQAMPGTQGSLI